MPRLVARQIFARPAPSRPTLLIALGGVVVLLLAAGVGRLAGAEDYGPPVPIPVDALVTARVPTPHAVVGAAAGAVPGCVCGDDCKCKPGQCPACPARSAVRVTRALGSENGAGRYACGSGTVVACEDGRSLVLTNAHVAGNGGEALAVQYAGRTYPAAYLTGYRNDPTAPGGVDGPDLALLTVAAELPAVAVAGGEPPTGARLRQWGFGSRLVTTPKAGTATDAAAGYDPPALATTIAVEAGDSGAGVFDDAGELVAVTARRSENPAAPHWAVPLHPVRAFLVVATGTGTRFPRLHARLTVVRGIEIRPDPPAVPAPAPQVEPKTAPKPAPKVEPKKTEPKPKKIDAAVTAPPVVTVVPGPAFPSPSCPGGVCPTGGCTNGGCAAPHRGVFRRW